MEMKLKCVSGFGCSKPTQMPLNIFHDRDGLPRIILTEPKGSSAEVCFIFFVSVVTMI